MSKKYSKDHVIYLKELTRKVYCSKPLQVVSAPVSAKGVLESLKHEEGKCVLKLDN